MIRIAFKGLTTWHLKLIAMGLMVLDHIHYFFEFTGAVPLFFSQLGRLSAWLFLFCTAEGFAHTSNRRRYFLRCYLIAVLMGFANYMIQFFGLTRSDGFFPANNIFAAFILCFILWQGLDELKKKRWFTGISLLALPFLWYIVFAKLPLTIMPYAYFLQCTFFPLPFLNEGRLPFLIGGLILYGLRKNRTLQLTVFTIAELAWNAVIISMMGMWNLHDLFTVAYEWLGVFSVVILAFYNGRRGRGNQKFFYWFYPVHVYLFYILSVFLIHA